MGLELDIEPHGQQWLPTILPTPTAQKRDLELGDGAGLEETEFKPTAPLEPMLAGGWGGGRLGCRLLLDRAATPCLYGPISQHAAVCILSPAHASAPRPEPRAPNNRQF